MILRSTDTIPGLDATMAEFENWTTDGFSRDTSNLAYVITVVGPGFLLLHTRAIDTWPTRRRKRRWQAATIAR